MKIRVLYIVLAVIVVATLGIMQRNIHIIEHEAERKAEISRVKDVELYRQHAQNIKDPEYAVKRGLAYLKRNETEKACIVFERAAKLDTNYRDGSFYLGYAYLVDLKKRQNKLGGNEKITQLNNARKALLAAQKIDPLYPMTNKLLGIVAEMSGDDKEKQLWYARYNTVNGMNFDVAVAGAR